jgi:polyphenol oxidase
MQFETFSPLSQLAFLTHAFTLRTGDDTKADSFQDQVLKSLGLSPHRYVSAEQTHGNGVAIVTEPSPRIPAVDALVTRTANLPLLIRCADCAAVYIVDRATPAIALVHSGKTGTLANVVGNTVRRMQAEFDTRPRECFALVSPSIGPCHYEMDIWDGIERQLREVGVMEIHNPRVCTACHLDRYFSYRAERGKTGRMLAVLSLAPR